jgi:hypothetical protein
VIIDVAAMLARKCLGVMFMVITLIYGFDSCFCDEADGFMIFNPSRQGFYQNENRNRLFYFG